MVRILLVVVLVGKLLILGWWAGLVPCPTDWRERCSQVEQTIEGLLNDADGRSHAEQWRPTADDEDVFGAGDRAESVTVGGPGLVAVGQDEGRDAAAVWTSTDGLSWRRVPHDEAVFGGAHRQWMSSVTAGGPGLVAVGGDEGRDAAAVWTSTDGLSWQRIDHDEALFSTSSGKVFIHSVTAGGPGLVAVGWDGGRNAAAIWTSTDGLSWHRVVPDESVTAGGHLRSVTVGGPGLVAVGDSMESWEDWQTGPAAVWTSADGVHWQRVEHDEAVFGGDGRQQMRSVTVGGPGLVAVGRDGDTAAVWTSVDGIAWQRVPSDGIVSGDGRRWMRSVTVGGPGLVAVGGDGV